MTDLQEIKRRLLGENRVDRILESMGCEYISYSGGRIEAQLPSRFHSENKRAVQIKLNKSLSASIRNRPDFNGSDIYSLISYIVHDKRGEEEYKKDLHNAKTFICDIFGWNEYLKGGSFKTKKDYVAPLKALLKDRQRNLEIKPNPVMSEEMLEEYRPFPSLDWINEGISYRTQKMYGIGFDLDSKRITIPMRNRFGELVGVKGRILKDEDDERKYLYLHRYQNRYEWFNFHYALPYIMMDKRVYIYEAEKSSMKAFELGIYNTVAIGASEISPEQAQMIKQIGLDIEIVFCYDQGINIEDIRDTAMMFQGRKLYALHDADNLLGKKDSPIDKGIDVWNKLVDEYKFEVTPKKKGK